MAKLMLVAACALIDRDGRVLLAKRPEDAAMGGLWEFPGGKLQDGETPETALVRELREELAIETEQSCLAPIGFASEGLGEIHLLMPLFVCRKWQGRAQPLVHSALKWVMPGDMLDYEMPAADKPLAAQLRDLL